MSASVGPDVNRGGPALGAIWTLATITILVVSTRCYTQRFITRQFGFSDILIIISVCIILSMASLITVQYHYGWGRHYIYIPPPQRTQALKFNAITQSFGVMGSTFGRLSFIVLMVKLFGTTRVRRWLLWGLFWSQLVSNGVVVVTLYVQCVDVRALWDFGVKSRCWDGSAKTIIGYVHSAWNGATDLFLTVLPATMLWTLKMNRKTKIGLIFLLSLSFLAFVGVIMKIVYMDVMAHRADYTYNTVPLFTWVIVEATLVAIASSVPLMRPLFVKYIPSLGTKHSENSYVLDRYAARSKPQPSFGSRRFSRLDEATTAGKASDTGSEDGILPIRKPEDAILKEVSYTVKITDVEKGEGDSEKRDRSSSRLGSLGPWERD